MRYGLARVLRPVEPVRVIVDAASHDEAIAAAHAWAARTGREMREVQAEPKTYTTPRSVELARCDLCEREVGERHECGVTVCASARCQAAHAEAHRRAAAEVA